jgi:hypothetical protein
MMFLFSVSPTSKGWRVLGNLGYASLWGVKATVSEIGREGFISKQSRLAAEGGLAVSAGQCFILRN